MFRPRDLQSLKKMTLNFNINKDENLIKAIVAYHKYWDIVDVNGHTKVPGEGFTPFKCGHLQQILYKLKNRASLADEITINCEGNIDSSLNTMMPRLQSSSLAMASAALTEAEIEQVLAATEKVIELLAEEDGQIAVLQKSYRVRQHDVPSDSIALDKLNQSQVMFLLNELKDRFASLGISIRALHLANANKIIFQPECSDLVSTRQAYVLDYNEPCCVSKMKSVTFAIDQGFYADDKDHVHADIIAELQAFYLSWKNKGYTGPVIADAQSGFNFVADAKADKLLGQLIHPGVQTLFQKLPADMKQVLRPNIAGQLDEVPTADVADRFHRKVKNQTINLAFYFTDNGYQFHIDQIYKADNQLIVVSSLNHRGGGGEVMVLSSDSRTVNTNEDKILPVKHYAISNMTSRQKTFGSQGGEQVKLVKSLEEIPELRDMTKCELLAAVGELAPRRRQP